MTAPVTNPPQQEIRDFRAALRALVRKAARQLRDETQCCGVGYIMSHVLLELSEGGNRSLKQLEEALETDKAALSRAVDFLVKDGLVSREQNPDDRRAIVIGLTAAGRKKVAEIDDYADRKYRCLLQSIPREEHGALLRVITLLSAAIDDVCGDAGYCPPRKEAAP